MTPVRKPLPGEDPLPLNAVSVAPMPASGPPTDLVEEDPPSGEHDLVERVNVKLPPSVLTLHPYVVTKGGKDVSQDGKHVYSSVKIEFAEPTKVVLEAGDLAANAPANGKWLNPFGPLTSKYGYPVLYTFSLIVALVCGTAGLPHILVRFYTNPNGKAARRTTFWVMVLLGGFYVFTPIWGTLGRVAMPELYANYSTDVVVLKLPSMLSSKYAAELLSAIVAAGAFAAFMSTFSGLLVSMSGAFARDIYGKILRPNSTDDQQRRAFQMAAVGVGVVSMGLGLLVETFDIATMVGWAFAIGAASYFPLLLLGSWWKGLTAKGAMVGMLLGGLLSLGAIVTNMLLDKKVLTW
jgi:cation/acetate symporter